jgi:hypothetical protein
MLCNKFHEPLGAFESLGLISRTPRLQENGDISGMRLFGSLLMFFSIACPIQAVFGQAVSGTIVAGFGGYYRIGKCMPIKVHLENSGSDLSGEITVQISQTSFSQAVSLPSPSRKTFVFYVVPPKYFHELEIKLFADGKLLKVFSSAVQRVSDEELLVVRSATLKQLTSIDNPPLSSGKEKIVYLDPQDFPESWNDYDAVNSVILDASDATRLNEFQRAALSRWTLLGGSVTLSSRDRIARPPNTDSGSASFRTVLGLGTFGEALGNDSGSINLPSLMDFDEEVFKSIRIKEPIPRSGIIRALGGFLLFYGLAAAFCLCIPKRQGTVRVWYFSIVPAVAILFSVCCPWIGHIVNGGNALVRQSSILHIFANSSDLFTTNDLSLLFPRQIDSSFRPTASFSYLVQAEMENAADVIHYKFEGKGMPLATFRTDLGSIRLLSLADFSNRGFFFIMRNSQSIALVNRSAFPLYSCSLIQNGATIPIGDLPAGKDLRLKSEPDPHPGLPHGGSPVSAMLSKTMDVYQTETLAGTTGNCVICGLNGSIPSLKSDGVELSYAGSTVVIYHLGKNQAETNNLDAK